MKSSQKRPNEKWKAAFSESLKASTLKGDYKSALRVAKRGLQAYPDEFQCRYQYAKLLGDYADELLQTQKRKLKREAIRILKPLLRQLRGVLFEQRFGACLNYYYQSEDFHGMYAFGTRTLARSRGRLHQIPFQKGCYAQALASGLIAYSEYESFNAKNANNANSRNAKTPIKIPKRAKSWALKSVAAWARYDLKNEKYYFAHYSFAKALALSGEPKKALKALRQAAKLAKRPITDWEFNDVLSMIDSVIDSVIDGET